MEPSSQVPWSILSRTKFIMSCCRCRRSVTLGDSLSWLGQSKGSGEALPPSDAPGLERQIALLGNVQVLQCQLEVGRFSWALSGTLTGRRQLQCDGSRGRAAALATASCSFWSTCSHQGNVLSGHLRSRMTRSPQDSTA